MLDENKTLTIEIKNQTQQSMQQLKKTLLTSKETIRDVSLITGEVNLAPDRIRELAEELIQECNIVLLGTNQQGKAHICLRISQGLVNKGILANAIIRDLAKLIDGNGGGNSQFATAGGTALEKLPLAFLQVRNYVP